MKLLKGLEKYLKMFSSEGPKYNVGPNAPRKLSTDRGELIKNFLERNKKRDFDNATILDLGSGWGDVSSYFAEREGSDVIALNIDMKQLKETKKRKIQNLGFVGGDGEKLPLRDDSVDVVIMCGVLEWVAYGKEVNVKEIQAKVLREVNRVLRMDGVLYLGIENRFGLNSILGAPENHIGLPFISLLPRTLANIYLGVFRGKKYRTWTYSKHNLEKMLENSGFDTSFYTGLPRYGKPKEYSKLNKNNLKKLIDQIPNLKYKGIKGKIISSIANILLQLGIFKKMVFNWIVEGRKLGPPGSFKKKSKNPSKEYSALKSLEKRGMKTPKPYSFDDGNIISMEKIRATPLSKILRRPRLSRDRKRKLIEKVGKWLGSFHRLTIKKQKSEHKKNKKSKMEETPNIEKYENIICKIHGDFNFKNILVKNFKDIKIIDFENYGYGSPLIDVYYFIGSLYVVSSFNPFLSENFRKELEKTFLENYFKASKLNFKEDTKKKIKAYMYKMHLERSKKRLEKGLKGKVLGISSYIKFRRKYSQLEEECCFEGSEEELKDRLKGLGYME